MCVLATRGPYVLEVKKSLLDRSSTRGPSSPQQVHSGRQCLPNACSRLFAGGTAVRVPSNRAFHADRPFRKWAIDGIFDRLTHSALMRIVAIGISSPRLVSFTIWPEIRSSKASFIPFVVQVKCLRDETPMSWRHSESVCLQWLSASFQLFWKKFEWVGFDGVSEIQVDSILSIRITV